MFTNYVSYFVLNLRYNKKKTLVPHFRVLEQIANKNNIELHPNCLSKNTKREENSLNGFRTNIPTCLSCYEIYLRGRVRKQTQQSSLVKMWNGS